MAFYTDDIGFVVRRWNWEMRRVWSPFRRCERSNKSLFLKKAFHGCLYTDWEYEYDLWLSKEEYVFAKLKGEFDV